MGASGGTHLAVALLVSAATGGHRLDARLPRGQRGAFVLLSLIVSTCWEAVRKKDLLSRAGLCPPGSSVIAGHLGKGAVSSQPSLSVPGTKSRLGVGPPEPLLGGWAGSLPAFCLPPSHKPMSRSVLCPQGRNRSVYAVAEQAVLGVCREGPTVGVDREVALSGQMALVRMPH